MQGPGYGSWVKIKVDVIVVGLRYAKAIALSPIAAEDGLEHVCDKGEEVHLTSGNASQTYLS
jgi:hypothetical protein